MAREFSVGVKFGRGQLLRGQESLQGSLACR